MRLEAPSQLLNRLETVMIKGKSTEFSVSLVFDFFYPCELGYLTYCPQNACNFTGEQKYETLMPKLTSNLTALALNESIEGSQVRSTNHMLIGINYSG